jgi:hypothetical protein
MMLASWAGRARKLESLLALRRDAEHGGSPHVGEGRTNFEGSRAGQEVPDSEATIEEARAVSNVPKAVA